MSLVGGKDVIEARANLFTVEDTAAQANTCLSLMVSPSSPPTPGNMEVEKFLADTGANRFVHPNPRSASTYEGQPMDIDTAAKSKSLKSEGVEKMQLLTPNGDPASGFDRVNFLQKFGVDKLAKRG